MSLIKQEFTFKLSTFTLETEIFCIGCDNIQCFYNAEQLNASIEEGPIISTYMLVSHKKIPQRAPKLSLEVKEWIKQDNVIPLNLFSLDSREQSTYTDFDFATYISTKGDAFVYLFHKDDPLVEHLVITGKPI